MMTNVLIDIKHVPEEVAHASLLVYTATSRNCIPIIQTVLE